MSRRLFVTYCGRHGGLWPWRLGSDGYNDCGHRPEHPAPFVDFCFWDVLTGKHLEV